MPFQPIDFSKIAPQGLSGVADMWKTFDESKANQIKSREDMLKHELEKAYGARDREGALGLQGAQTRLAGAQAGKLDIDNQAALRKAQRMEAFQQMLSSLQNSGGMPQQAPFQQPQDMGGAQQQMPGQSYGGEQMPGMENLTNSLMENRQPGGGQPQEQSQGKGQSNADLMDALYKNNPQYRDLFKESGFDVGEERKYNNITGEEIVTRKLPSGAVEHEPIQVGKSRAAVQRYEDTLKDIESQYSDVSGEQYNLSSMLDILSDPEAMKVLGPLQNFPAWANGTPEQQRIHSMYSALSGEIALNAAKNIKGPFTGRDLSLVNSIKPHVKDPYHISLGKLEAMYLLNDIVLKRLDKVNEYVEGGMSKVKAEQRAANEIDLSSIRDEVKELVSGAKYKALGKEQATQYVPVPGLSDDANAYFSNPKMTQAQRAKIKNQLRGY